MEQSKIMDPHLPLDAPMREALQRRTIKKHDTAVILLHWFNVSVWVIELATGGALLAGDGYRIAPDWWRTFIVSLFGSPAMVLKVHITVGVIWTTVLLVYGIFGFKKYFMATITRYLIPDRDDFLWLKNRLLLRAIAPITGPARYVAPNSTASCVREISGEATFSAASTCANRFSLRLLTFSR